METIFSLKLKLVSHEEGQVFFEIVQLLNTLRAWENSEKILSETPILMLITNKELIGK